MQIDEEEVKFKKSKYKPKPLKEGSTKSAIKFDIVSKPNIKPHSQDSITQKSFESSKRKIKDLEQFIFYLANGKITDICQYCKNLNEKCCACKKQSDLFSIKFKLRKDWRTI